MDAFVAECCDILIPSSKNIINNARTDLMVVKFITHVVAFTMVQNHL
jgi:hypothetical protein